MSYNPGQQPVNAHPRGSSASPLLSVRNLARPGFGPFNFDLAAGECLAITGESGAGKSVLLRMLADLDPCTGEVLLGGVSRQSWPAPVWRKKVTYQAAEPAWWTDTMHMHLAPEHVEPAHGLLPLLKLRAGAIDEELSRLSTGERQRLALIRSLVQRPQILLLDEPASALDAATTASLEQLLKHYLSEGMSIIIVTHSIEQVARMADRTFTMQQGALTQS
jgi:ABC-type iron transport system FetAB ATPase subunit